MGFACVVVNIGVFTHGANLAWQRQKNNEKILLTERRDMILFAL
jgi:hypothetical protein